MPFELAHSKTTTPVLTRCWWSLKKECNHLIAAGYTNSCKFVHYCYVINMPWTYINVNVSTEIAGSACQFKVGKCRGMSFEIKQICRTSQFVCWQKHTKAPQAAGRIHTDFEKGFIMAEVMKFDDFKAEGSEAAVKVCWCWKKLLNFV